MVRGGYRALAILGAAGCLFGLTNQLVGLTGDRVVVEVNGAAFTQRQVEIFSLIRQSLGDPERSPAPRPLDSVSWKEALQFFSKEMIILQDAQRSGGFLASGKTVDAAINSVRANLKRSPVGEAKIGHLQVESAEFIRYTGWVLRIEAYRRSKERQVEQAPAGGRRLEKNQNDVWKKDLEERAVVRFFDGALEFVDISPRTGK